MYFFHYLYCLWTFRRSLIWTIYPVGMLMFLGPSCSLKTSCIQKIASQQKGIFVTFFFSDICKILWVSSQICHLTPSFMNQHSFFLMTEGLPSDMRTPDKSNQLVDFPLLGSWASQGNAKNRFTHFRGTSVAEPSLIHFLW